MSEALVEFCARGALDFREHQALGGQMRFLNLIEANADGVAQIKIVAPPLRDAPVEELLEWWRGPGGRMHAVGDGVNRIFREHLLRNFAVLHGHAVGVMRTIEGQRNQVHFSARAAIGERERGDAIGAENFRGQFDGKFVEGRSHGSMRGENALLPDGFDIRFGNRSRDCGFAHSFLQQRQNQQARNGTRSCESD